MYINLLNWKNENGMITNYTKCNRDKLDTYKIFTIKIGDYSKIYVLVLKEKYPKYSIEI